MTVSVQKEGILPMKRLICLCLAALLICMLPLAAFATETEATTEATEPTRPRDACGENLTWKY